MAVDAEAAAAAFNPCTPDVNVVRVLASNLPTVFKRDSVKESFLF